MTVTESNTYLLCLSTTASSFLLSPLLSSYSFIYSLQSTNKSTEPRLHQICDLQPSYTFSLQIWPHTHLQDFTPLVRETNRRAQLTLFLVHLLLPIQIPGSLWQQLLSLCMDVTTHLWRDDAAQIPDVIWAINQQPAISWGICKPPQGLDGQRKTGGVR